MAMKLSLNAPFQEKYLNQSCHQAQSKFFSKFPLLQGNKVESSFSLHPPTHPPPPLFYRILIFALYHQTAGDSPVFRNAKWWITLDNVEVILCVGKKQSWQGI